MKNVDYLDDENADLSDEFTSTKRHLFRTLVISVSLGVAIVGGLTIWQPPSLVALEGHRPMTMLEHSGSVLLNVSQLRNHISLPIHGNYTRYWIGPIAGDRYTTNCVTPGILKVSYFKSNQALPNQILTDGILPRVTVSAYENFAIYNIHVHAITGDSMTNSSNSLGDPLSIDTTSLARMVIGPLSTQEVITVTYSSPQTFASMVRDSEDLTKL